MLAPYIVGDGRSPATGAKPDTVVANLPHRPGCSSTQDQPATLPGKSQECQAAPGNPAGRDRAATVALFRAPGSAGGNGVGCGGTCTGPLCSLHMRGLV